MERYKSKLQLMLPYQERSHKVGYRSVGCIIFSKKVSMAQVWAVI